MGQSDDDLERLANLVRSYSPGFVTDPASPLTGPAQLWFLARVFIEWTARVHKARSSPLGAEIDDGRHMVIVYPGNRRSVVPPYELSQPHYDDHGRLEDFSLGGVPVSKRLTTLADPRGGHVGLVSWCGPYVVAIVPNTPTTQIPERVTRRARDAVQVPDTAVHVDMVTRQAWSLDSASLLCPVPGGVAGKIEWLISPIVSWADLPPSKRVRPRNDAAEIVRVGIDVQGGLELVPAPVPDIGDVLAAWCRR